MVPGNATGRDGTTGLEEKPPVAVKLAQLPVLTMRGPLPSNEARLMVNQTKLSAVQHAVVVAMGSELAPGCHYDRPMLADALSARIGRWSACADGRSASDRPHPRGTA